MRRTFWIGLGALSVLGPNALSTGATVLRARLGTVVGFAIGRGLVAIIGVNHVVLWTLVPIVVFVAASAPPLISFVAGQAAFTVFTIILFKWYAELADVISARAATLPPLDGATNGASFLDVVLAAVHGCGDPDRARRAEPLLWSGQYLGDVDRLRADLATPAALVGSARRRGWWRP